MNRDFLSFAAVQENWQFGPLYQLVTFYAPGADLERPWTALWQDQAIRGPFEDHGLTREAAHFLTKRRYGCFNLPDGEPLGFCASIWPDRRPGGLSLWIWFPPRMVRRVVSADWYVMPPAMKRVQDPCVSLLRRLHDAAPFRVASVAEESWGHWPLDHDLPDALPQGAIVVDERLAPGGVSVGGQFVWI